MKVQLLDGKSFENEFFLTSIFKYNKQRSDRQTVYLRTRPRYYNVFAIRFRHERHTILHYIQYTGTYTYSNKRISLFFIVHK